MLDFIKDLGNMLQGFFFGDYWFIVCPLFLAPILIVLFFEVKRAVKLIQMNKKNIDLH